MVLSDASIIQLLESKTLLIEPFSLQHVQPASYDLTLSTHFLFLDESKVSELSLNQNIPYKEHCGQEVVIQPRSFCLASTTEYIKIPNGISAFVEGRSSIGRMGLFIQNAGWVDTGFEGQITLELFNASPLPIRLESGRRICQLVFCNMDKPAKEPYQGKYLKQRMSVGSLISEDTF